MNDRTDIWNGFKRLQFDFEGRKAIIVFPENAEEKRRFLLKTEYFGAFPAFETDMLSRGWHLAYIENKTRWHSSEDDGAKARFCDFLKEKYGLSEKCVPVGMSCGGMHAVYFAAAYPEKVSALYLDAPVLNLLSCPCGVGHATNEMYLEFCRDTGMSVSEMINYRNHPIDRVPELIAHKIPVFIVAGGSDNVVPFGENGAVLAEKYEKTDIPFRKVIKPECGHHPHGLEDRSELIEFFERF